MHRDRPLQNSMFLQDTNGNRRGSIEYINPTFPMNKNSQINHGLNVSDNYHPLMNNQSGNTASRGLLNQEPKDKSTNRNLEQRISEFSDKLDKIGRMVDKHEFQLGSQNFDNTKNEIFRQVTQEIKQTLPVITGNSDVYEHIFNMKVEMKNIKDEITKFSSKIDIEGIASPRNENRKSLKDGGSLANKEELFAEIRSQILKPRDDFFKNMINSIETQMGFLKKNMQGSMMDLKVSPISSSSCVLLKYQELFKSKSRNDTDMIISEQTYYIDNEGYLLDCNSRYLVDQKGQKVKLQEKHITMLRNQRIIQ